MFYATAFFSSQRVATQKLAAEKRFSRSGHDPGLSAPGIRHQRLRTDPSIEVRQQANDSTRPPCATDPFSPTATWASSPWEVDESELRSLAARGLSNQRSLEVVAEWCWDHADNTGDLEL